MAEIVVRGGHYAFDVADAVPYGGPISVYKGVIVAWDPDRDTRILDWIDTLDDDVRSQLVSAHESKGSLSLRWASPLIPPQFAENRIVDVLDPHSGHGDCWPVIESRAI